MKLLKSEWLQLLILAAPFCAVALLWDKLPAQVPIHWNARGQIDGYAGKAFGTLFLPLVNVGLAALLGCLAFLDPKIGKSGPELKSNSIRVLKILRLFITSFMSCIAFAILAFALHYRFDMNRFIGVGMGLLFAFLGNFMGKLRPNYFAGIRTPWTLESPTVWAKTHQFGGRVMVAGGICMIIATFVLPPQLYVYWFLIPFTVLIGIVPLVYSYFCYRQERQRTHS